MGKRGGTSGGSRLASVLGRLGLDTRARQSWVLFDFGDNAFATVVNVILQTYFITVAGVNLADGRALIYWSFTVALSYGVFAVLSPVLGAIADHLERSRAFLGAFTGLGVERVVTCVPPTESTRPPSDHRPVFADIRY